MTVQKEGTFHSRPPFTTDWYLSEHQIRAVSLQNISLRTSQNRRNPLESTTLMVSGLLYRSQHLKLDFWSFGDFAHLKNRSAGENVSCLRCSFVHTWFCAVLLLRLVVARCCHQPPAQVVRGHECPFRHHQPMPCKRPNHASLMSSTIYPFIHNPAGW